MPGDVDRAGGHADQLAVGVEAGEVPGAQTLQGDVGVIGCRTRRRACCAAGAGRRTTRRSRAGSCGAASGRSWTWGGWSGRRPPAGSDPRGGFPTCRATGRRACRARPGARRVGSRRRRRRPGPGRGRSELDDDALDLGVAGVQRALHPAHNRELRRERRDQPRFPRVRASSNLGEPPLDRSTGCRRAPRSISRAPADRMLERGQRLAPRPRTGRVGGRDPSARHGGPTRAVDPRTRRGVWRPPRVRRRSNTAPQGPSRMPARTRTRTRKRRRRLGQVCPQLALGSLDLEHHPPAQSEVQNAPERVQVRAGPSPPAADLLGRDVVGVPKSRRSASAPAAASWP